MVSIRFLAAVVVGHFFALSTSRRIVQKEVTGSTVAASTENTEESGRYEVAEEVTGSDIEQHEAEHAESGDVTTNATKVTQQVGRLWRRRRRTRRRRRARRRAPHGSGCSGSIDVWEHISSTTERCSGHFHIETAHGVRTPPNGSPIVAGGQRRRQRWYCDAHRELVDCGHGACLKITRQNKGWGDLRSQPYKIECGLCRCKARIQPTPAGPWSINGYPAKYGAKTLESLELRYFPMLGSHNAGSHPPLKDYHWGSGAGVVECLYENHDSDIREQLKAGVRFFDLDTCLYSDGHSHNCHGTKDGMHAYGQKIWQDISYMNVHLRENPTDIIVLRWANMDVDEFGGNHTKAWEMRRAAVSHAGFKKCQSSRNSEPCFEYGTSATAKTKLRDLIRKNARLIIGNTLGMGTGGSETFQKFTTSFDVLGGTRYPGSYTYQGVFDVCMGKYASKGVSKNMRGDYWYSVSAFPKYLEAGGPKNLCISQAAEDLNRYFTASRISTLIKTCHNNGIGIGAITFDYVADKHNGQLRAGVQQGVQSAVEKWGTSR